MSLLSFLSNLLLYYRWTQLHKIREEKKPVENSSGKLVDVYSLSGFVYVMLAYKNIHWYYKQFLKVFTIQVVTAFTTNQSAYSFVLSGYNCIFSAINNTLISLVDCSANIWNQFTSKFRTKINTKINITSVVISTIDVKRYV